MSESLRCKTGRAFPIQRFAKTGESGTQYSLTDAAVETRGGVRLTMSYDTAAETFRGEVVNTTSATVTQVRVEIHLSNGVELGPTPRVDLAAGQSMPVELDASQRQRRLRRDRGALEVQEQITRPGDERGVSPTSTRVDLMIDAVSRHARSEPWRMPSTRILRQGASAEPLDSGVDSKLQNRVMDSAAAPRHGARNMRIGQLAAATDLTPDALRYYERKGLLDVPRRSAGGFRLFGPEAVARVRFVKQAQALGLALDEIRRLVDANGTGGPTQCRQVQPLLRAHLAELDARLADLRGLRRKLKRVLDDCERQQASRSDAECPMVHDLERDTQRPNTRRRETLTHFPRPRRRTP